jgi:hypothetical protein
VSRAKRWDYDMASAVALTLAECGRIVAPVDVYIEAAKRLARQGLMLDARGARDLRRLVEWLRDTDVFTDPTKAINTTPPVDEKPS